mmetsp:Transcript_8571/g.35718  ORF Transcript_8571/g.35718 Transcript_8571/m.35718 type:complete len:220 (-) Transcript_8571:396-1055(-)
MRHDDGQAGEALHAAEALCQLEDAGVLEERSGAGEAAAAVEGDHAAEAGHLALGQLVVGVAREAGVEDALHLRVRLQEGGDCHCVGGVLAHAQVEGLDAAHGEEAVERRLHRAHAVLEAAEARMQLVRVGDEHAAEYVRVAVDVLGHRVHHEVRAQREGPLEVGREEGVVHHHQDALARRPHRRHHGGNVDHLQQRVGRRLQPDHAQPRVLRHKAAHLR